MIVRSLSDVLGTERDVAYAFVDPRVRYT